MLRLYVPPRQPTLRRRTDLCCSWLTPCREPCRFAPVQAVAAHDDIAGASRQCLHDPPYPVQLHPPHYRVQYLGCALVCHELGQGGSVFRGAVRLKLDLLPLRQEGAPGYAAQVRRQRVGDGEIPRREPTG